MRTKHKMASLDLTSLIYIRICATYIEFSKILTEVTRQACTNLNFLFFREVDPMQQKLQHNKGSFSSVVLAKSLSNT